MDQDRHMTIVDEMPVTGTIEENIRPCPCPGCKQLVKFPDDGILLAWLDDKTGKTQSVKTHINYHRDAVSLRRALRQQGLDLFMDLSDRETLSRYLLVVQGWAGKRAENSHFTHKYGEQVKNATYNNRLGAISSLFGYVLKKRLYEGLNPIDLMDRRVVRPYEGAQALSQAEVQEFLKHISRKTTAGKRDYAMIVIALETGTRGQALLDVKLQDLTLVGNQMRIFFRRMKGNKNMTRLLEVATSKALLVYLQEIYGPDWQAPQWAQNPVWISLSTNGTLGHQLTIQALEDVYLKHLKTSKSHTTRHTAALMLALMDVPTHKIQGFLEQENLGTTGHYIPVLLHKNEKGFGKELTEAFGIAAPEEEEEE